MSENTNIELDKALQVFLQRKPLPTNKASAWMHGNLANYMMNTLSGSVSIYNPTTRQYNSKVRRWK